MGATAPAPPEDPFLLEAYVFGDVLRGAAPLECVEAVLILNLPPQEVWAAPRFPDRGIAANSCGCLPVQVFIEDLLRGPVSES